MVYANKGGVMVRDQSGGRTVVHAQTLAPFMGRAQSLELRGGRWKNWAVERCNVDPYYMAVHSLGFDRAGFGFASIEVRADESREVVSAKTMRRRSEPKRTTLK